MKNALMNARSTTSGDDGRFELAGLASGPDMPLSCVADKPGIGRSKQIPLPADDTDLTVTIQATSSIVLTVVGASDGDRLLVKASAVDGGAMAHTIGVLSQGVIRLDNLVPGSYRVDAMSMQPQRSSTKVTVEVTAGHPATAPVAFVQGGVTVVIVPGATCKYAVLLKPTDGDDPMVAATPCSPNTPAELDDIAPGDYRLCIGEACQPITVAASPARQTFTAK